MAKLRPHGDSEEPDVFLIADPTQTAISDGVVLAWRAFAKVVSIQHAVYFQARSFVYQQKFFHTGGVNWLLSFSACALTLTVCFIARMS